MTLGFDGFSNDSRDYYDVSYSFAGSKEFRTQSNEKIRKDVRNMSAKMKIEFITPSMYVPTA